MSSQFNSVPLYTVPFVDGRHNSRDWYFFLMGLFRGLPPANVAEITAGTSPYTYTATARGVVLLTGGTVSLVEFSRDGVTFYDYGTTVGQFAMNAADQLRVTYSSAPDMVFIPS